MERRLKLRQGWAGLDEAGRGPLAGPVVAAAVILPRSFDRTGIDDSKKLSREQREEAAERIREKCVWAISIGEVEEIDRINILRSSLAAMKRALDALEKRPLGALVDGNQLFHTRLPLKAVVEGDAKYAQIAAASILAKTFRDDLMRKLAEEYPGYGFESHFGYSTPEHYRAIEKFGPCPLHRRSFSPFKEAQQPSLAIAD
jgi:ribonuclease HII